MSGQRWPRVGRGGEAGWEGEWFADDTFSDTDLLLSCFARGGVFLLLCADCGVCFLLFLHPLSSPWHVKEEIFCDCVRHFERFLPRLSVRAFFWNSEPGPQLEAGSWPPRPLPWAGLCVDWPLSAKLTDSWLMTVLLSFHFYIFLILQHLRMYLIPEKLLPKAFKLPSSGAVTQFPFFFNVPFPSWCALLWVECLLC